MDLPLLSALFMTFAITLYVVLDGFDLGVGILLLFQPAACVSRSHGGFDYPDMGWKRDLDNHGRRNTASGISDSVFNFAAGLLYSSHAHVARIGISGCLLRVPHAVDSTSQCMGRCICSWLIDSCIHARSRSGWPSSRSNGPEPILCRKCSRYPPSSSSTLRHHSPTRLRRTRSRMAQTQITFGDANVRYSLDSYCGTGFCIFVRHRCHVCGHNTGYRSLPLGVTRGGFYVPSGRVCPSDGSVDCGLRKGADPRCRCFLDSACFLSVSRG